MAAFNGQGDELTQAPRADEQQIMAIMKKLGRSSDAYREFVGEQMLKEANYFSERLKLPTPRPIQYSDLKAFHISPPWYGKILSTDTNIPLLKRVQEARFVVAGVLYTTNFSFAFNGGKLWEVHNTERHMERFDLYPAWAKTPSSMTTNGAHQLATQWLSSVSVDVASLERKYPLNFYQWSFPGTTQEFEKMDHEIYHPPASTNRTMLPVFDVKWGDSNNPAVKVTVFGPTRELLELQMLDSSFSKRSVMVITNAVELNSAPDPPAKDLRMTGDGKQTNVTGSVPPISTNRPPPFHRRIGPQ